MPFFLRAIRHTAPGPLSAVDEMNQALPLLIEELKAVPDYVPRFQRVFQPEITTAGIVKALAQFERTLISSNSRYDKYKRKEAGGVFMMWQRC